MEESNLTRTIDEVMKQLENYTLTWHHWLLLLSLMKLGGSGMKAQIFPVYKKEGFSPHAIESVFKSDIIELGAALEIDGDIENLQPSTMIYLTEDVQFRKFLKKHLKSVVNTLKMRKTP
jgi:hypothetical protein